MTDIRLEQVGAITVDGGTVASPEIQQLGTIVVAQNVASTPEIQQLGIIVVASNGVRCVSLGPAIGLGCWSPCGTLLAQGN